MYKVLRLRRLSEFYVLERRMWVRRLVLIAAALILVALVVDKA